MRNFVIKKKANTSTFDQLKTLAMSSGLFNSDDYNSLGVAEKQQYIMMLASNGKALNERLGKESIYSKWSELTANEKLSVINSMQALIVSEQQNIDATINQNLANDETIANEHSWAKWTTENKYDGDYSKFVSDYNDRGFDTLAQEGKFLNMPSETFGNLNSENAQKSIDYISSASEKYKQTASTQAQTSYQNLLTHIDYNIARRRREEAWNNASWWEKTGSTIAQLAALPVTEGANIIEGVYDAVVTGVTGVFEFFGADVSGARQFVETDTIALDTYLNEILPNSWATSEFSSEWNLGKIIYNFESSMIDMVPLALNIWVPGLGTAIYYTSSAGRTAEDFLLSNENMSVGSAVLYTAGATAIEFATEKISGLDFFGNTGWINNIKRLGSATGAGKFVSGVLGEALEEVIAEVGSGLLYGAFTNDYSRLNISNIAQAALLGGLMGGVMTGSNLIQTRRIVNNVELQLAKADGSVTKLSNKEIAIYQQYLTDKNTREQLKAEAKQRSETKRSKREAERVRKQNAKEAVRQAFEGKTLAEKLKMLFNGTIQAVKDGKVIAEGQGLTPDEISEKALQTLQEENATMEIDGTKSTVTVQELNNAADTATQNYQTATSLYLTQLSQQFGFDYLQASAEMFNDYSQNILNNLADRFDAIIKTDKSSIAVADKLAENFKGTEFKIVEHPELDNLKRFVATLNVQDINARRAGEATVFTFVSNKLETSPVIALEINNKPVIFVNAALFNDSAVQNIYKMVTAQLITYRISKSMSSNVLDIIDRYIERGNVTSISKEVQRQQLLQVMLFVQGNDLMQLVKWTSESDLDIIKSELSKYWSSLSLVTKNVAAQGMQTLDAAILEGVTEEQLNDVRDRLSEISEELPESELQQLHVKYSSQYHKANANAGRISFIADINYTTAQVALLVRYLQNHLNFDYDITGKSINQIARAVMDFNNYSDKGKALSQELQRFPVYRLSPDKSLANAPTVFSTKDSMNYFLAQLFDIQISDDYRIVALNEVEDMLIPEFYSDEDDLDFDMNVSDDAGKSRYKLSQFISKTARDRLGASFIDYDIYFVKRTTQAGTLGYTVNYSNQLGNTGGAIFVALLNDSRYIKEVLRHEIVHALANMSGLPDCLSSVVITVALESELAKAESLEEPGTLDDLITDLEQFLYRVQNVVWQGYDDAVTLGELFDKPAKYYLTTAKGRSTLADLMYVYFFANEANADSKRGYYTDSDDFRGTYLNSYLFSQVILTTQSQDPFLKRFNNATFRVKTLNNETLQRELNAYRKQAISKDAVIDSIIDVKPEFRSDTGKLGEDITVEDLKEFFGGKEVTDAQLQDRNFWIDNASSQRLREQLQACDNNYFAKLVEAYTGYMYNGEEALFEEPAYSKNELEKSYAKLFAKNEDYFAGLRNNKPRPINTELSKYVFGEYGDEFVGAIAYNADLGKATIQLDRLIMGQKTIAYIERIAETIGPQNMKYTVGSRVFNNFAAARRYRDTSEVNADSIRTSIPGDAQYANFDNIFTHLSNATTFSNLAELEYEGFRNANAIDTILVTNDGKGYGYNLEGNLFNKIVDICEQNNIPTDILMKHAVTPDGDLIANNEGLTNDVSKLFDSKRVVRLYKTGDGWQVFGKPNMLQDRFLKTFGIEPEGRYNPFVVEKSKVELIQDEHGRVTIAQKRKDGTFDGKRVGWANQKHYQLVCQLLTRYNITEFNQLYKLGFDEDFVKSIALYAGRGKRADHVLTNQGGLSTDTLIRYICDTTKSKASRNILINLLFPNNAHLQSVDDLDTYYKALESYRPLMLANNDSHVYSSIFELEQIYGAKIRAQQFTYNEKRAQAAQIAQTRFGAGSERKAERGLSYALYRMLQMDARQDIVSSPNGMDLSLSAFNTLASAYTQGFAEAPSKGEISIEGTQSSGRHADDNFQTDITDQVAAREAVTVETVWTSEWMTDFSTRVQEALRLPVPAKIKELTRLRDEYDSPDKPDTSDEFDLEMEDILYTYLDELVETGNNISPTGSKTFELSQAEKFIENFRAEIEEGQQKTGIDRQKFDDSMLGKYLDLRNNKQRYIAQYGKTVYDQMRQLLNQAGYSAGANVISNWQNKMSNDLTKYEKLYVDGKLSQKQYDTLQRGLDIYQDIWNSVNALTKISYSERINLQQTIYNSLKNFTAGQNERDVVQSIRGLLIEKARAGEIRFEPVEQAILAGVEAVYKNAGNEAYVAILREKIAEYDTPKYRNSLWAVISRLEKLLEDATAISIRPQARKSRRSLDLIELEVNDKLLSSAEDEGKTISGLNASVREAYNESVRQNLGKNPKVQGKTKGELTAEQKAKEERNKELWFLKNRQFLVERQIKRIEELSKSPEVSEIEIQNAIKEAYNTVMNFKFDNFKDILRSDASEYWKNNFKDLITRRKYLKKLSKDASLSDADKLEIADEIERINQRQKSEITKYIKKYEDFDRWRADALRAIKQQEFEKRITPDAEKAVIERQVNDYFASLKNILDHSSDYYTEEYKSKMHNHSKAIQDVAKFNSNLSALEKQKYISDLQAKFYRENQPEYTEEYHNAYNEYYGRMNEWLLGKGNKYAVYGRYGLNERRFQDLTVFDRQSERQAKILIGLRHALYSLYIAPKTKAAIDKFKADIQSVLSETRLNERIPGTNELVRIFANKDSSGELIVESEDVLDDLRTGKYIDLSLADYKISVNSTSGKITLASEAGKLTELDAEREKILNKIQEIEKAKEQEALAKSTERSSDKPKYKYHLVNGRLVPTVKDATIYKPSNADSKVVNGELIGDFNKTVIEIPDRPTRGAKVRTGNMLKGGDLTLANLDIVDRPALPDDISNIDIVDMSAEELQAAATEAIEVKPEFRFTDDAVFDDAFDTFAELEENKKQENPYTQDVEPGTVTTNKPTINSPLLKTKTEGIDLSQIYWRFQNVLDKTGKFNSEKFIKANVETLNKLQNSEVAATKFLDWAEKGPTYNDMNQLICTVVLANQISAAPLLSTETQRRAKKLVSAIKSTAGRALSVNARTGLTPLEEITVIMQARFDLSDEDRAALNKAIQDQKDALKNGNFKLAEETFDNAIKVLEKYADKLDNSINFFAKNLTKEDRAIRLNNFTKLINNWRYFSMLSAPATFFARNYVGNLVLQGLNKISETVSGHIESAVVKGSSAVANFVSNILGTESTFTHAGQYVTKPGAASKDAQNAVNTALIDNGLIDSIMKGTVAKYDSGYDARTFRKLGSQLDMDNDAKLAEQEHALLSAQLNERTPFGTSIAGRALNKCYNFIFDTMNKADHSKVRGAIISKTTKIISDNFSTQELQSIADGTAEADIMAKFNDVVEYARIDALKTYLRYTPAAYDALMKFFDKHPLAKIIFSIITPFPRMVLNTIMTGLAYSPLGFIKGIHTLMTDATAFRNITANKQFSRAIIGSTIMAVGAILAAIGFIDIDQEDEYAGPQLNIGGFRIALEDLAPGTTALAIGAVFAMSTEDGGVANGFKLAADALLEATVLGELSSLFGTGQSGTDIVMNIFANYVNQFIPAVLRHTARIIDPSKKKYSNNQWLKLVQRAAAAIPGLSFAIDAKVDPYTGANELYYSGENEMLSRFFVALNAILPAKVSYTKGSEVEVESEAVGAGTTGPVSTYTIDGQQIQLDDKTFRQYQKLRAKLYNEYAQERIKTEAYKKASIDKKKKILKSLQDKATQMARKQLKI